MYWNKQLNRNTIGKKEDQKKIVGKNLEKTF